MNLQPGTRKPPRSGCLNDSNGGRLFDYGEIRLLIVSMISERPRHGHALDVKRYGRGGASEVRHRNPTQVRLIFSALERYRFCGNMFTASTRLFVLLVMSPCLAQATAAAQDKSIVSRKPESVTLGLSARHVLNLPIYLAQRHGIFESEGFDFKPITTKTNTAIAALVSGDLDYITALNSGLAAAVGGAPLVATYVSTDKPLLYLVTRPDIKDAKALRGGIIGHGGTRGSHYHASVAMVKHLGLDPDKDVKLISTIDVTQGLTALFSGAVAATTLSPPYDSIAVRKGYNRLVSGPDVLPRFVENGLVMRRVKLRENPDQVRRMLRAFVRGLRYAVDHPNDAIALIQKEWNLDRETARVAYEAVLPTYNQSGECSDELIVAAIKRAQQDAKITLSSFAPKDFVDWTIIRQVQRELTR